MMKCRLLARTYQKVGVNVLPRKSEVKRTVGKFAQVHGQPVEYRMIQS